MDKNETQFNTKHHSNSEKNNEEVTMTEHLSALLDDEAGAFEQRRVLDELKADNGFSQKLSHFALIGESMRSSKPVAVAGSDFLAGIHAQIDEEPEYNEVALQNQNSSANDSGNKHNAWLRPVGGFALAASVAAIAVVGFQNYQVNKTANTIATSVPIFNKTMQKDQLSLEEMNAAVVISADKMDASSDVASNEYQFADARSRSLLKRFVDKHIRHASTSSFVPSVRVIAYADYK